MPGLDIGGTGTNPEDPPCSLSRGGKGCANDGSDPALDAEGNRSKVTGITSAVSSRASRRPARSAVRRFSDVVRDGHDAGGARVAGRQSLDGTSPAAFL